MTSFGWKRKAGSKLKRQTPHTFITSANDSADEDAAVTQGDVDWLTLAPQKRAMILEDAVAKSNRLKQEGEILAESERYWEALSKWEQALQLTPNNERLLEMKAQAYMQLNELYPALQAAEKAVELQPLWSVGHQTLGRARLGLGEVRLAIKCFSRAIHLNPADEELWQEDLKWSSELLAKKRAIEEEALAAVENKENNKIIELDEEGNCTETEQNTVTDIVKVQNTIENTANSTSVNLGTLPGNYVFMRD